MIQSNDSLKTARETLVLAFDLAGAELRNAPERIVAALRSPEVQAAIRGALEKNARALMTRQLAGQPLPADAGRVLVGGVTTAAKDAALAQVKSGIEQSPRYRMLMGQLEQMRNDARQTPVGVYLDTNQNALFLLCSTLAVGGLVALYEAGTGDRSADVLAAYLNNNKQKLAITVGALEVGLGAVHVRPSERAFDLELLGKASLRRVTGDFQLKATARDGRLNGAGGRFELSMPLESGTLSTFGSLQARSDAPGAPTSLEYDLGLRLKVNEVGGVPDLRLQLGADLKGDGSSTSAGVNAFAGLERQLGRRGALKFGLTGSYNREWSDIGPDSREGRIELGLSINL